MSVAAQSMRDDLNWTETQKGYVLSAFYWGYSVGQIPASLLMMNGTFSPKWTFGFAVFIPSVLTLLVPLCARTSYSHALIIRMLIGVIESATFPSAYEFFVAWIPPSDKTFMIATMFSGTYMGEIIGFSLSGALIDCRIMVNGVDLGGWPSVFYFFGLLGVLWFPVWAFYAYENPESHPHISSEELQYIRSSTTFVDNASQSTSAQHRINSVDMNPKDFGEDIESAISKVFQRRTNEGNNYDESMRYLHSVDLTSSLEGSEHSEGELKTRLLAEVQEDGTDAWTSSTAPDETTNLLHKDKPDSLQVGSPTGAAPWSPVHIGTLPLPANAVKSEEKKALPQHQAVLNKDDEDGDNPYLVDINEKIDFWRIPWRAILRHPGFWNLIYSGWCMGFIQFLLLSEVPSYLTDVLGFSISDSGILSTLPFGFMLVVAVGNGRWLLRKQKYDDWSVQRVRRVSQSIAMLVPAVFMLLCAYATNDQWLSYAFIAIATMSIGAIQSGLSCAYLDFAPRFSPFINTLANACGAAAGILGPIMVSALITAFPEDPRKGWNLSFLITAIMCSTSVVIWFKYAVSEPVKECNELLPLPQTERECRVSNDNTN